MFDKYPYTNFHELNLDYFIKEFKRIFDQWDELYTTMTSWKDATDADLAAWKASTLADMTAWETALLASLDAWKAETGTDISSWESGVLSDLADWKDTFTTYAASITVDAEAARDAAAASATAASGSAMAAAESASNAASSAATVATEAAQIATNTTDISYLKTQIQSTWKSVLLNSITTYETVSNWYKSIQNALENTEYDFVITSQTAGTYSFQIGTGVSADLMVLDVGTYTFEAGETKTITYTPIGSHLRYFRFYSESVPVTGTIWSLVIQNKIDGTEIKESQTNIDNINNLVGCKYLPTIKGQYFNTSGTSVDITSPISNAGWNSAAIPCAENDTFTITGTGGSTPKLWAFADSNGDIVSRQDSAVNPTTVTDYILYAPKNSAYFVVNFENSHPFRLVKGLLLDYKFSIPDYADRITTKHKVIVDANGNGDFTTIQAAIDSITDTSFSNQYEIVLMDGTYNEQNLILPDYTYLHGVGYTKPIITSVGLSDYVSVIDVQKTCRIANVKIISGTKYCIHEDVSLKDCTVICENVDFEQIGTMNHTIVGNGAFENAKFIFNGCTFKDGQVFSHTNSTSFIGVTQHFVIKYCKFINAGIVLAVSGNVESNTMAECICEVIGCRGDGMTPLITCRVPSDNVYPWKVIGGSNINFNVVFDGPTLTDVINTTDA